MPLYCGAEDRVLFDKVRLYRRVQRAGTGGSALTQFDLMYVTEQRTSRMMTVTPPVARTPELGPDDQRPMSTTVASTTGVLFDCDMFNDHDDEDVVRTGGYCFVYVSTANSGAVNEQKSICLPTYSNQPGS